MPRPPHDAALRKFTRDLTAEARAGRLDPIRCRGPEIDRVVDVLLRHGKNNPVLVGAAGVGKTAIVEGLAQRAATDALPFSLRGSRVLSLDHMALLGGTMYRGQYEERMQAIVAEVSAAPDVILFVDELHNLVGQGTAQGAAMDAGNMLKPALTRGDFRVIGATTSDEYERWIMSDPALERRFQRVEIRELTSEETLEVLRARQRLLERHHGVLVNDDAITAALRLTDEWLVDRVRPDRAIDALDEACAHVQGKTKHGARSEALLHERREAIAAREAAAGPTPPPPPPRPKKPEPAPREATVPPDDETTGERVERYARDGMAALERFGTEIENLFAEPKVEAVPKSRARPTSPSAPADPNAPPPPPPRPVGEIEAELSALLMADGAVVRGVDVARVVGRMVGRTVSWP